MRNLFRENSVTEIAYHIKTPLLVLPNLICTPHTGGNSFEAVVAMGLSSIEHLIRYRNNTK